MGKTILLDTTAGTPTAHPALCLTRSLELKIAFISLRYLLTLLPFFTSPKERKR